MTTANPDRQSVYLIYSTHQLLLREALGRLVGSIKDSDSESLDVARFNAGEQDAGEIISACQTLSFFGGRRLVIAHSVLALKKNDLAQLCDYIQDPNPKTILVLSQTLTNQQQTRQFKAGQLFKVCANSQSARVHQYEIKSGLGSWIKSSFALRNKYIDGAVVDYLLKWVGNDLNRLSNEIAKICDSSNQDKIELEFVRKVAVGAPEAEVFDLIGAVIARDTETALTRLSPILIKESEAGNIFNLLERQFRLILGAKTKGKGLRGQALAKMLGISKGAAFYIEKQSHLFSPRALKKVLRLLVEADLDRKTGQAPSRLILEKLVVDLCAVQS